METAMISANGAETTFRQRALAEIKRVTWDPAWGEERISNMIATRPDWCISRQRIWGVPIAVFLCRKCGEPLKTLPSTKPSSTSSRKKAPTPGTPTRLRRLLPAGTPPAPAAAPSSARRWTSSTSGSSPAPARTPSSTSTPTLRPLRRPRADLYAEGGDQHRGWFHSSLLCSIGIRDNAPPTRRSPPTAGPSTRKAAPSPNPSATASIPSTSPSASAARSSASGSPPSTSAKTSPPAKT